MRQAIVSPGSGELVYEIREIVKKAHIIRDLGVDITWENIGDPVQKGIRIPAWIKSIISELVQKDETYAYTSTKGYLETRQFLADLTNKRGGIKISAEDILFFNGLGDAIAHVYGRLRPESRVIGPSPAYSTHSSGEGAHAGLRPLTYKLDPKNNWLPDLEDLRKTVQYNSYISGILVINPDNPTGMIYPKEIMQEIVKIARDYDLFVLSDEIYLNIHYNNREVTALGDVIGSSCGIAMKGISKEFPWPGARCGWLEFYNYQHDREFERFVKSLENSKMVEVASTTLPQMAIPKIISDSRYQTHLNDFNQDIEKRANMAHEFLKNINGVIVNKTYGAFYTTIVFQDSLLNPKQRLKISNPKIREKVDEFSKNVSNDMRFAYELLGATGICIVPISTFCTELQGFRMTLLEQDLNKFQWILNQIKEKILEYLRSA